LKGCEGVLVRDDEKFWGLQRIAIVDEIALSLEESVDVIGEIALNLRHPQSIRSACDPADLYTSRRDLHEEENDKPLKSTPRPHFYGEKVTSHNLLSVPIEKLPPSRLSAAFRRARYHGLSRCSQSCCEPVCAPDWPALPVSVGNPTRDSLQPSAQSSPRFRCPLGVVQVFETNFHHTSEQSIFGATPKAFQE